MPLIIHCCFWLFFHSLTNWRIGIAGAGTVIIFQDI